MEKLIEYFSSFERVAFAVMCLLICPALIAVAFQQMIDRIIVQWKTGERKKKILALYLPLLGVFTYITIRNIGYF